MPGPAIARFRWVVGILVVCSWWTNSALSQPGQDPCGTPTDAGSRDERLRVCEQHYKTTKDARSAAVVSEILRAQGKLAWDQSHYREALDSMDRAVRYGEGSGDRVVHGKALRGMFTILLELGDLEGAGRTLNIIRRAPAPLDARTQVLLAFDEGLLNEARERPRSARSAFEAVLRSSALRQVPELEWTTTLNLLAMCVTAGDLPCASEYSAKVDALFSAGPYKDRAKSRVARGLHRARFEIMRSRPEQALELLAGLARDAPASQLAWKVAYERGRALKALGKPDAAAAFEDAVSIIEGMRNLELDDFKSAVVASRRAPYLALFELHREKEPEVAAAVVERMQGRTFLDALASAAQVGAMHRPNEAAERLEWLAHFYPTLRALPVLGRSLPIPELTQRLRDQPVLTFFETEEAVHLIQIEKGQARIHRAPKPLSEIRRLLTELLNRKDESPTPTGAISNLSEALFPAGLKLPAPGTVLHVVMSPSLAKLPLAALLYHGKPLAERQPIVLVPSLTALAELQRRASTIGGPSVVIADSRSNLPAAALEGSEVHKLLGGTPRAQLHSGAGATKQRLLSLRRAPVLHLAVHSDVGPEGPYLQLQDGPARAGDVLDAAIRSDLVVLASCASSVTLDPGLWGSMVAAFLAGGASTVVGTLWSIKDAPSRRFVLDFYRSGGAKDPARALARVQSEWMANQRPLSEWAGFAVFGRSPR